MNLLFNNFKGFSMFSDKEKEMFLSLDLANLMHFDPAIVYRMAVEKAFLNNLKGKHIESLRRTAKVFLTGSKPYRMTSEFDSLISLS